MCVCVFAQSHVFGVERAYSRKVTFQPPALFVQPEHSEQLITNIPSCFVVGIERWLGFLHYRSLLGGLFLRDHVRVRFSVVLIESQAVGSVVSVSSPAL